MKLRALLLVLAFPTLAWAQARTPLVQSVDVQIPVAPTPTRIAGRPHLAYELHVTNFRTVEVALTRVQVLNADGGTTLVDLRDSALASALGRPGAPAPLADRRVIGAGMRAVVHLWFPLDPDAATPPTLGHLMELELIHPTARERVVVRGPDVDVRRQPPIALDPPLRGGPWVAVYDPAMMGGHRTSIYTLDGRARIPGRFAIDWMLLDGDAKLTRGDGRGLTDFHGYGAEVLAVADGVVAQAMDDIAEETPVSGRTAAPMALEDASGNYVALDLGGGRYAFYEHLKPGSIRVKAGDRVRSGQVIGLLGNSGSSSAGPHLHFHVSDANATLAAEGLPFVFRAFLVEGAFDDIGAVFGGGPWKPASPDAGGVRAMELPAANVVVRFDVGRAADRERSR